MTIHIEICKSFQNEKWNLRIGDLEGSIDMTLLEIKEVLTEIEKEMFRENKTKSEGKT